MHDAVYKCLHCRAYKFLLPQLIEEIDRDTKRTFLGQTLDKMDNDDTFLSQCDFMNGLAKGITSGFGVGSRNVKSNTKGIHQM